MIGNSDKGLYLFRREIIVELISKGHKVIALVPYGKEAKKIELLGCSVIKTDIF